MRREEAAEAEILGEVEVLVQASRLTHEIGELIRAHPDQTTPIMMLVIRNVLVEFQARLLQERSTDEPGPRLG